MGALGRLLNAVAGWRGFKPAVFVACLAPGAWLAWRAWRLFGAGDETALGPDPLQTLLHETGETALAMLLLSLTVTPVRRLFGVNRLQSIRRMVGVWSFVYAAAHLFMYLGLEQLCYSPSTCEFRAVVEDVLKRRFIFMGMLAFAILFVLTLTSTNAAIRRLKKRWQTLHRLVYVAAVAGVVHFIWIQKSDYSEPAKWAVWLAVLFGVRVWLSIQKRRRTLAPSPAAAR